MSLKKIHVNFLFILLVVTGCEFPRQQKKNVVTDSSTFDTVIVRAKRRLWGKEELYAAWRDYDTRILDKRLKNPAEGSKDFSLYGGWLQKRFEATGFFYTKKVDGRWWLVDPEGYLYIDRALCSVRPLATESGRQALNTKFGDETRWIAKTTRMMRENGFFSSGAFSNMLLAQKPDTTLNYTAVLSFMRGYAQEVKGVERYSAKTRQFYVFESDFKAYCHAKAEKIITSGKTDYSDPEQHLTIDINDPHLIGYFSDNELPFDLNYLDHFLAADDNSETFQATKAWHDKRKGKPAGTPEITDEDRLAFLKFLAEEYFKIVTSAISSRDPNHLFLGSRFHHTAFGKRGKILFETIEPYADVISLNWYNTWTPSDSIMQEWERIANKPIMITEFYVKGNDTGMPNQSGAGWIVKTQKDRGDFYQHYTLALLESKTCVGWHWYRYQDNDITAGPEDPSNADSNKGIVTYQYELYDDLTNKMALLNNGVYDIISYFDNR